MEEGMEEGDEFTEESTGDELGSGEEARRGRRN